MKEYNGKQKNCSGEGNKEDTALLKSSLVSSGVPAGLLSNNVQATSSCTTIQN